MAVYYTRNGLYAERSLREFNLVSDAAQSCRRIQNAVYYLYSDTGTSSKGELLRQIGDSLVSFLDDREYALRNDWKDADPQPHLAALDAMEARLHAVLKAYCGLTEADLEQLPGMESQEIVILLGRRMGIYE